MIKVTKLATYFFLAGFICLGVCDAAAQKQLVDRSAYLQVRSKATDGLYEKKRSVETISEEYLDGVVVLTVTRVYQYLASDNYRFHHKTQTSAGITTETEEIRVGHFLYRRDNSGPWTKEELRNSLPNYRGAVSPSRMELSQITVESVFLGSFLAELYEDLIVANGRSGLDLTEKRLWIGQDGSLLQEETVNGTFSPRVVSKRTITKYEYDPNIKIEAPIN